MSVLKPVQPRRGQGSVDLRNGGRCQQRQRRELKLKNQMLVLVATCLTVLAGTAWSQQPVYLCNGTYTDRPCANGKEVDIAPTEGMHSLSGQKRQSQEAVMRDVTRQMQAAQERGMQQGATIIRCNQLQQERMQLDRTDKAGSLTDRRLAIRQEQFKLGCKQN